MQRKSIMSDDGGQTPRAVWRVLQWLGPRMITPLHVSLYRLLGGRLVGGSSTLLLTTVGRRSGQPRTVTVGYLRDGGDVVMMDTNFARPAVPAWVFNLRAHPEAEVRLGRERYRARAEFLEGEERAGQWDRQVAAEPLVDQANDSLAERSLSSGCVGLRVLRNSNPRTLKSSACKGERTRAGRACQSVADPKLSSSITRASPGLVLGR